VHLAQKDKTESMRMKKWDLVSMIVVCFILGLSCNNPPKQQQPGESSEKESTPEEKEVLKKAEEIAFSEYGEVIKKELPLKARLSGDSIWIIEGTLPRGADGGTVYIELSKGDHVVLKITHYK
jgi:hypothetical protein